MSPITSPIASLTIFTRQKEHEQEEQEEFFVTEKSER
jgi:hypothetical protein